MKKQNRDYNNFISFVNEVINDYEFQAMGCITKEEELKEKYGMTTTEFVSYETKLQKMFKNFQKINYMR